MIYYLQYLHCWYKQGHYIKDVLVMHMLHTFARVYRCHGVREEITGWFAGVAFVERCTDGTIRGAFYVIGTTSKL